MMARTRSATNRDIGYVVKRRRDYYTGNSSMPWTPYRQFAKVYRKRGWAQKAADKWGGEVVEVEK